jgi:DNA-binding NarL/FixJ family response regulator
VGTGMIRVAIVEDHPVFRKGLMQVVEAAQGLELAGGPARWTSSTPCG